MPFTTGPVIDWMMMGVGESNRKSIWASSDITLATVVVDDMWHSGKEHHLELSMRYTDVALGSNYDQALENLLNVWLPGGRAA